MYKYYFEMDAEFNCKEECEYFSIDNYGKSDSVYVGSLACKQCEHNVSYCGDENWVKCKVFSAFAELELLKKENDSRFSYIVKLTKEIEDLKSELEDVKIQLKKG